MQKLKEYLCNILFSFVSKFIIGWIWLAFLIINELYSVISVHELLKLGFGKCKLAVQVSELYISTFLTFTGTLSICGQFLH